MGRFGIKISLEESIWSTKNTVPKIEQYTNTSTDWTLFYLDFTLES